MLTQRQALEEARGNIACGTSIAARIKETSQNPEIRELAKAVYFIGFGSQQIVNAFTDSGGNLVTALVRKRLLHGIFCSTSGTEQSLVTLHRPFPVI